MIVAKAVAAVLEASGFAAYPGKSMLVHRMHGWDACDYDEEVGFVHTPVYTRHVIIYDCAISHCAINRKSETHKSDLSFDRIELEPIGEGN